jgi:hypothetical protein
MKLFLTYMDIINHFVKFVTDKFRGTAGTVFRDRFMRHENLCRIEWGGSSNAISNEREKSGALPKKMGRERRLGNETL